MATSCWIKCSVFILFSVLTALSHGQEEPTFSQCRVHIEAAMKGLATDATSSGTHLLDEPTVAEVESNSSENTEEIPIPEEIVSTAEIETNTADDLINQLEEEVKESTTDHEPEVTDSPDESEEQEEHVVDQTDQSETEAESNPVEDESKETSAEEAEVGEHSEGGEEVETDNHSAEVADQDEQSDDAHEEEPQENESTESEEEPEAEQTEQEHDAEPEPEAESAPEPEPVSAESKEEVEEVVKEVIEPLPEAAPVVDVKPTKSSKKAKASKAAQEEPVQQPVPNKTPEPEPQIQVESAKEIPKDDKDQPEETTEDPAEGIIEEAPDVPRSRAHIADILRLGQDIESDMLRENYVLITLKEVKKVIETAVRPLETIFKYKDVSNRNFGDPEIFSKPMVLFLGPWSGGKSSIINYLLGTEFTKNALKTGAEPSATFFQVLMFGDTEETLDGTQLAADWTFSGLQKFGQAFIDRLRGKRLPNKILEKANIVEVPGILEVRKQVDRPYPFNDVVQWFIDRADLIFVVYDPTKLDTGLEHEALFDQLKGRQSQVRILLNKADSVTQEELLLIQNNLVWNLSPLMASPLPPTLYAGSFWSRPYKPDAPTRLLQAHEESMLQDIRDAIDNVVENTIAEARRHAVRVRNHAKMVDCYLTTFYNQKGFFGNKKKVAEDVVDNPHAYHIFEGLSTLSNISRYDLPDADVYKDFFRLHPLYEFKPLASTCTFFRGCPLDKLDTAIAYELPELIGKYKKRLQGIPRKG